MKNFVFVSVLTAFGFSGAAAESGTAEQKTSPSALEEIVVTATRREERLQDVPISVTAVGEDGRRAAAIR